MGFLISLLSGTLPMLVYAGILYWLDRYEKEPLILLGGTFLWGAIVAAWGAFLINTLTNSGFFLVSQSQAFADFSVAAFTAPVIEEFLKGAAVLLVMTLLFSEFDSILDGIIYAGITALGFAASENTYYIYQYGFVENGWQGVQQLFLLRAIILGWSHPFYTSFTGIGLAVSRTSSTPLKKIVAPVLGLMVAIFTHSVHNIAVSLLSGIWRVLIIILWDWMGWLAIMGVIIWATAREKHRLQRFLQEELERDTLTKSQYQLATSAWKQILARLRSIRHQQLKQVNQFFQLCSELSHKKYQHLLPGQSSDFSEDIARLREEISTLSKQIIL